MTYDLYISIYILKKKKTQHNTKKAQHNFFNKFYRVDFYYIFATILTIRFIFVKSHLFLLNFKCLFCVDFNDFPKLIEK